MASSSLPSHFAHVSSRSCKYDVFLSFRGEDTRKTFVDHLYSNLKQHLISVFKDNETLPRGDFIHQSLFKAIEESQIAVIIFSKNYAESSWCLDELAHIMKCKDERELIVIPIFYDVAPTELRNHIRKFGKAFVEVEPKNIMKAEIWRKALVDVSNIAGWEPKNIADGHESEVIRKIVDTILDRLFVVNSCIDEDLVGMRARFQDLESLIDIRSEGVCMVGLWGIGGGGKTTLATSICLEIAQHFQGHCIIENVREKTSKYGLSKLQENILSALFKREVKVHSVVEGKHMMKSMLCRRKVLILLDDVDKLDQLEALAGKHNWFGSGSRIIITTRDEHLLRTHKVDHVYPIKLLSNDEAIQLFKRHAYNEDDPVEDYEALSLHLVSYASGLPLLLKVLGSFLYDKNKNEWISAMKKLKDVPNPIVINILKISYNGLEPYEKELFLDIACFWRSERSMDAMEIHEACGFHPEIGIKVLKQKSLITTMDNGFDVRFDMHDLVQEMAHNIVRGDHPKNPEKHSRVWKHEDITGMCLRDATIIKENDTIEAIKYDPPRDYNDSLPIWKLISNLKKLRWLKVKTNNLDKDGGPTFLSNELRYIDWNAYHEQSLFPNNFLPMELVVLKLTSSTQTTLWKNDQHLPNLKVLYLEHMTKLLSTPDFNRLPRLQKLTLDLCMELEEIHTSFENHTSLEYLNVSFCDKLKRFPTISHMKNIKTLLITWSCLEDGETLSGIGELSNLQELNLSGNGFSRLGFSLSRLTRLKTLDVSYNNLLELPELPSSLAILAAFECDSLTFVADFNKDCKQLCQVSLKDGWSDILLQSMLKGEAIENGLMHLYLEGLDIAKGFTPPLRTQSSCRLELPDNWCNDFSGFLMCAVFSSYYDYHLSCSRVSMKQVSCMDSEDYVAWEESVRDEYTSVWYVSFGSLRHTTWWDQTYNMVSFEIDLLAKGFGVRLVDNKNRRGITQTSIYSTSHYKPKIDIHRDSTSELVVDLYPYAPS